MCKAGNDKNWAILKIQLSGSWQISTDSDGQVLGTKLFFHVFSTEKVGISQHLEHTYRRLFDHLEHHPDMFRLFHLYLRRSWPKSDQRLFELSHARRHEQTSCPTTRPWTTASWTNFLGVWAWINRLWMDMNGYFLRTFNLVVWLCLIGTAGLTGTY